MIDIPEITLDALTELINLSVGRSANALNEMIGHEVSLSVPKVELMEFEEAQANLHRDSKDSLTTVCQDFNGPIEGKSLLIMPERNSLELVQLIIGEDVPVEDIPNFEEEALIEVGNVILNAFLGSLGNELRVTISSDIPTFSKTQFNENFNEGDLRKHTVIMFVHVDFQVKNKEIKGYLILVVNLIILKSLIFLVDKYLERIT
jgi:chemotaxis protein CheC